MIKKSVPLFAIVILLCACGSSRFVPVQPIDQKRDWSVTPWEQADRNFEKPYENPEQIYQAFEPKNLSTLEALEPTTPVLPNSPIVENETIAEKNVSANNRTINLEIASVLTQDAAVSKASLTQKQLKKVDKIERKLDKRFNYKQGSGNGFDWTKLAIIIAIVGGAGLVVFLATGWFFGLFLFILAGAALVCKWTGILDF